MVKGAKVMHIHLMASGVLEPGASCFQIILIYTPIIQAWLQLVMYLSLITISLGSCHPERHNAGCFTIWNLNIAVHMGHSS